jgi:hypothetical protein
MKPIGEDPHIFGTQSEPQETEMQNCWDFFKCAAECPVRTEKKLHKVHRGMNAGRACWVVAGTMCGGSRQGTHVDKKGCLACEFYKKVQKEEFSATDGFKLSTSPLKILEGR